MLDGCIPLHRNQSETLTKKVMTVQYKGYEIKPQGRVDFKLREAYEVNGQIVYGLKAAKQLIDKLLEK